MREIASNLTYPRFVAQWVDIFLNCNLQMRMKFCCLCNACMHVSLAVSLTCCNDDVSRLVIEHACCSLFHALAAYRPSRPVPVNRVAGRRLFGISRTRCNFAFSVILFHVSKKWSKRDEADRTHRDKERRRRDDKGTACEEEEACDESGEDQ